MLKKLLVIGLFALLSSTAQAQIYFGANNISKHSVTFHSMGFVAGINYNYKWSNKWLNRDLSLQLELDAPVFLLTDLDSWLFEASLGAMLLKESDWNAGLYYAASSATANNILGSHFSKSSSLTVQPGYYRSNWFVAADLRLSVTEFVYIQHSDRQKDFYSDIPNSSASNTSLLRFPNVRYLTGAIAAYTSASGKWTFIGSAGALFVPQAQGIMLFPEINLLPFYFTLDVTRHF